MQVRESVKYLLKVYPSMPAYQWHTHLYASMSCSDSVCNCVWAFLALYFFGGGVRRVVFVLPLESPSWRGIWLEWMLPGEYGLVSRQHPLKDTLPNAVGLENKGSPPLLGKYACYVPQPISTPRLSRLAFSLPFCFHTSSSFLPLSLTIFSCVSLSTLSPSCDALHAISYLFTPASPVPLCQPVPNCVSPLHLAISLVSFLFLPLAHLMHFPQHPHFYLLLPVSHFVPVSLLSGSFFCFVYFPSHSLPVEVGLNPNQLLSP